MAQQPLDRPFEFPEDSNASQSNFSSPESQQAGGLSLCNLFPNQPLNVSPLQPNALLSRPRPSRLFNSLPPSIASNQGYSSLGSNNIHNSQSSSQTDSDDEKYDNSGRRVQPPGRRSNHSDSDDEKYDSSGRRVQPPGRGPNPNPDPNPGAGPGAAPNPNQAPVPNGLQWAYFTNELERNLFVIIQSLNYQRKSLKIEKAFHFISWSHIKQNATPNNILFDETWAMIVRCFLIDGHAIAMALADLHHALPRYSGINLGWICGDYSRTLQFVELVRLVDTRINIWLGKTLAPMNSWTTFVASWNRAKIGLVNAKLFQYPGSALQNNSAAQSYVYDSLEYTSAPQVHLDNPQNFYNVCVSASCLKAVGMFVIPGNLRFRDTSIDLSLNPVQYSVLASLNQTQMDKFLNSSFLNSPDFLILVGTMCWNFAATFALKRNAEQVTNIQPHVQEQIYLIKHAYTMNLRLFLEQSA